MESKSLIIRDHSVSVCFDAEGNFIAEVLGQDILDRVRIITMRDNQEMFYYSVDEGIWKPKAEAVIMEIASELLGQFIKKHYVEEAIYYIKTRTFRDRAIFEMPVNLIPLKNGILDIVTLEFRPYTALDFFTTYSPIQYDPDAICPSIDKFFSEVVNTEDDVLLLKEVMAYCLYRAYPIQKAIMLIGEGNNGKSVYLGILKELLGSQNASAIPLQDLEVRNFAKSAVYSKWANIYSDVPDKALATTGTFKMLTGGDLITADKKFKDPFNFVNFAKLLFSCNRMPKADDDTDAYHRRWIYME